MKGRYAGSIAVFTAAFAVALLVSAVPAPGVRAQSRDPQPQAATEIDPKLYTPLRYRFIGPIGNRVIAVAGEPGNPNVAYIGAASGGIFKTIDGGTRWDPIFDDQPVSSVGSLAIAPSNHNIVWAGTGETFIRSNISIGNGIYKSIDAGKTWTHMGLDATGRIGRIVIHPTNPDIVFAAALGHAYGPQPERGVYRTTDGGKSWQRVLFVDEHTGSSDIAMDPSQPEVLFAGMWQLVIHPWGKFSGGPGSGLFVSRDGGTTWTRLKGRGLPDEPMGKVAVAVAPSSSRRVYALIELATPGFFRSDDGGENWKLVSQDHTLVERPHYYTRFAVAPDEENRIYFLSVRFSMSLDGGLTRVADPPRGGGDTHDMWIDPADPDRMMVGDDGGVNLTSNRGRHWRRIALPIAQMYHVHTDNQIPYNVYGNRQDGYSYRGPSVSREPSGRISVSLWHAVGGCESGFAIPDPVDSNIVWSGCYDGGLERFDLRTRQVRDVRVWPDAAYGWPPEKLKYRFNWTFPIAISPHDHDTVYVGSQHVHRTKDGGHSWTVISPDLTTNDKSKQRSSGGLVPDNLMVEYSNTVFAIAESPTEAGVIWAGTADGLVHVTRDAGASWTDVTANIPSLPPLGIVSNIEPSRFAKGAAYITVDLHQMNNRDPFVYKTTDYGKTWRSIGGDVPRSVFSYAHCVREDPVTPGLLYLGTENALYVSFDDGRRWHPLQNNLPHAPVHWLTIQEQANDLVVGTYGRGFWILDDITPLRRLAEAMKQETYLFPPRTAYRFRPIANTQAHPDGQGDGQNAPYGINIDYWLKAPPKGAVTIQIVDAKGDIVRTLADKSTEPSFLRPPSPPAGQPSPGSRTTTKEAGLNRVWWDLRHGAPKEAKLRTAPPGKPFVKMGPDGWRPLITWDLDIRGGQMGPLVGPGTYTVKLIADGREVTQPLVVRKDPHSAGSEADVEAQLTMSLDLKRDLETVVDMINQVEWVRWQLENLMTLLGERSGDARSRPSSTSGPGSGPLAAQAARDGEGSPGDPAASFLDLAKALEKKAIAVEARLYDINLTGARSDAFRAPIQLYEKLASLASNVGASSADFAPTTQQLEVHKLLKQQLASSRDELRALIEQDVTAFNLRARDAGVPTIMAETR